MAVLVRNLKAMTVVYWVNVSQSSGTGLPGLSRIQDHYTVVLVLHVCDVIVTTRTWLSQTDRASAAHTIR